ncbi:unnamed protein product [Sphagnum compactum]
MCARFSVQLSYGRPVESFYPGSHYHPQTVMSHGPTRPLLPDVQFSVPMESRRDVEKVKDALDLEGVHGVVCDLASQTVTVSGNVPFHRLLKKLKHVKRRSKLLSFSSPDSPFSPSYGHESLHPLHSSSYHAGTYPSNYGSSYRRSFSPPHSYGSSYVRSAYERPYYEDYEDYRPYRY